MNALPGALAVAAALAVGLGFATPTGAGVPESVRVDPEIVYSASPEPAGALPFEVHYKLVLNDRQVILRLQRRHQAIHNVQVFLVNGENLSRADIPEDAFKGMGFYQDVDNMAALSLKVPEHPAKLHHDIDGTFYNSGSFYRIRPIKGGKRKRAHDDYSESHTIERIGEEFSVTETSFTPGDISLLKIKDPASAMSSNRHIQQPPLRLRRTTKPSYEVDLLYVTDYSLFQIMQANVKASNPQATLSQVVAEMQYYFSHVENQVDLRYRRIDVADWMITTKLVSLYIVTSSDGSSWTEELRTSGRLPSRSGVEASRALISFRNWINTSARSLGFALFDHAALFTGYDLYANQASVKNYNTIGLAYTGAMCTSDSSSIIEFGGMLSEGQTQAHELGHSLGANHDGEANACVASDQFLMTAMSSSSVFNQQNQYLFSTCSLSSFKNYISSLNRAGTNCMLNTLPVYDANKWSQYMSIPPAKHYTADDQCRQAFGITFAASAGSGFGKLVCSKLWCYNTADSSSTHYDRGQPAIDGTTCGDKRWCMQGKCVYNSSAPEGSDTCPLGDLTPAIPVFANEPFNCSRMPAYYCYEKAALEACCKTCGDIYKSSELNCEYGDKTDCSTITLPSCRFSDTRATCCKTCQDLKLSIPGCEWGDEVSGCAQAVSDRICSQLPKQCCKTCYDVMNPGRRDVTVPQGTIPRSIFTSLSKSAVTLPDLGKQENSSAGFIFADSKEGNSKVAPKPTVSAAPRRPAVALPYNLSVNVLLVILWLEVFMT